MELKALPPSTTNLATRRSALTSSGAPTGRFGGLLKELETGPAVYEIVTRDQTHSFGEMPIVAPSNEAVHAQSTSSKPAMNAPLDENAPQPLATDETTTITAIVEKLDAEFSPRICARLAAPAITEINPAVRGSGGASASFLLRAPIEEGAHSVNPAKAPIARPQASPSLLPFALLASRTAHGLNVRVRTELLSNEERQELLTRIGELAREYGMTIDRVRISGRERK